MLLIQRIISVNRLNATGIGLCLVAILSHNLSGQNTEWSYESIRAEIDPAHSISKQQLDGHHQTLILSGDGKEFVNGSWTKTIPVIYGNHYEFATYFKSERVEEIDRCILASITWLDANGKRTGFIEYPGLVSTNSADQWREITQIYKVPDGASFAKMERWDRLQGPPSKPR